MGTYAGVDWASAKHDLVVLDEHGTVVEEDVFVHDERGISRLCQRLLALAVQRVAIERPDGLLVGRLLDAGVTVLALHPNQVKATRPRFQVAAGKSDRFDAMVLAELARTDAHRFRVLVPDRDETRVLRALTRAREDLVQTRVALANQLRAELEHFWPGAARIFAEIDSPIALAFLERYPTPADTRTLGEQRLAGFLARNGYSGRRSTAELLARLRAAPDGRTGQLETEARRHVVLALVAALTPLVAQIRLLTSEIAGAVRAHPDGPTFLGPFRDTNSVITAATLLAEIGDCRARYPTNDSLAADAGMSAVAIESGKRKTAAFRRACDHRLRTAFATLADSSRHHNPWARRLYTDARARGHTHQRAIRTVGRAWTRVLWRAWHDHQPYDPTKHRSLTQQLNTQG